MPPHARSQAAPRSRAASRGIEERLDELPVLPAVVYELSRAVNDPMSSTADVERIMAGDQSMTTKVLRLANSAYYAIPGGVSSLQRAVAYVGYDAIHQLVLSASVIQALKVAGPARFDMNKFWQHSIGAAMASETIARALGMRNPHDMFTCGLIHDMGKVAHCIVDADSFAAILDRAKADASTFAEAEDALGAPKHAAIGKALAERWRLPPLLQSACAYHHQPTLSGRGGASAEMNASIDVVYAANLIVHALKFGDSGHAKSLGLPRETMDRLRLDAEKTKSLISQVRTALASADGFLKIIGA